MQRAMVRTALKSRNYATLTLTPSQRTESMAILATGQSPARTGSSRSLEAHGTVFVLCYAWTRTGPLKNGAALNSFSM